MPTLSALYTYPLKSAAGVRRAEAVVEARGLAGDRRWMLVDEDGRFLSQRTLPAMALLRVGDEGGALAVEAPGMPPLGISRPEAGPASRCRVQVWEDTVEALPAGEGADAWFTRLLGRPCRLVYMPDDALRPVDPDYAVGEAYVSFADGYPLLLASQASLDDLNRRLAVPVPMDRFRPNLVVAGAAPFEEDTWETIRVGDAVFHVVKPCARCSIVTVDQGTGEAGKEPLRTLSRFRKRNGKVLFGQNLIPAAGSSCTVRAGDPVEVLSRRRGPGA